MWKRSLKARLTLFIILPVLLVLLTIGGLGLYATYDAAEGIYDTELSHVAALMAALLRGEHQKEAVFDQIDSDVENINPEIIELSNDFVNNEQQFKDRVAFRIWKNHKLLYYSERASDFGEERVNAGFSTEDVKEDKWRFYVRPDTRSGTTLEVAQKLGVRASLVNQVLVAIFAPLIFLLPIILLITGIGLRNGLKPLMAISEAVKRRSANDLTPLRAEHALAEIVPLVDSINKLLVNLDYELKKERRFTDFAAHELRTPIAILKTQAQTALKSTNDAERRTILEAQVQAANRATKMVDQLLDLARLEQVDIPAETLPLNGIVQSVVQEKQLFAAQEHITLRFEQQALLTIRGNKELLAIILSNLIDNAIKYTPAHGDVVVSVSLHSQAVLLTVSDTGPGIPEDKLPYVTEHFYRVPGQQQSGAGLGLAIAKRASELIGSTLILKNKNVNQGLEATICFPSAFS